MIGTSSLLVLLASAEFAAAHPSYWNQRLGHCHAPSRTDTVMGYRVQVGTTFDVLQEMYPYGQAESSFVTDKSEHLLVASEGIFSNPSQGGQLLCGGKMVAWNSPNTRRTMTWDAPPGSTATLAGAGTYGPITIYTLTAGAASTSTYVLAATDAEATTTMNTTTSQPVVTTSTEGVVATTEVLGTTSLDPTTTGASSTSVSTTLGQSNTSSQTAAMTTEITSTRSTVANKNSTTHSSTSSQMMVSTTQKATTSAELFTTTQQNITSTMLMAATTSSTILPMTLSSTTISANTEAVSTSLLDPSPASDDVALSGARRIADTIAVVGFFSCWSFLNVLHLV